MKEKSIHIYRLVALGFSLLISFSFEIIKGVNSTIERIMLGMAIYTILIIIFEAIIIFKINGEEYRNKSNVIALIIKTFAIIFLIGTILVLLFLPEILGLPINTEYPLYFIFHKWLFAIVILLLLLYVRLKNKFAQKEDGLFYCQKDILEILIKDKEVGKIINYGSTDYKEFLKNYFQSAAFILQQMTTVYTKLSKLFNLKKRKIFNDKYILSIWLMMPNPDKKYFDIVDFYCDDIQAANEYKKVMKKQKPIYHNDELYQKELIQHKKGSKIRNIEALRAKLINVTSATGYVAQNHGKDKIVATVINNVEKECTFCNFSYQDHIKEQEGLFFQSFVSIPLIFDKMDNGCILYACNQKGYFPKYAVKYLFPLSLMLNAIFKVLVNREVFPEK